MLKTAKQLLETGKAVRPHLGIELDPKFSFEDAEDAGLDKNIGARVEKVAPQSPGASAGIRPGDIILSYKGVVVEDDLHLVVLIAHSNVGDEPEIQILRNRRTLTVAPRLAERAAP